MAAITEKVNALFSDTTIENQQLSFVFDRIADGFMLRAASERARALKAVKDGTHNPGGWSDAFAFEHIADTLRTLAKLSEHHNL